MRRIALATLVALATLLVGTPAADATIHPIVESFDCANAQAFAHHPLGDVADPMGQTPGATPGGSTNELAALSHAAGSAFSSFKLDGSCGAGG